MKRKSFSIVAVILCSIILLNALESWVHRPKLLDNTIIEKSATKALALLQRSSYEFTNNNKFKCASCHHNTLMSMAAEIAKEKGVSTTDSLTTFSVKAMQNTVMNACNPNLINQFLPANFAIPYLLLGLDAQKYPGDFNADIAVDYVISQAKPDGSFLAESGRVPLETGDCHLTAMAIRSIELYASPAKKQHVNELVAKTRHWLENKQTSQQQELAFQLLGLQWCGSNMAHKAKIAQKLKAMQNEDGGWSQLPTLKSDAYATGQALYALYESGMEKTNGQVYQKGLDYLLKTQDDKGAWFVATRSYPIQPFVNSNFPPYDDNQFISAAGSNWATIALLNALPDKTK